MWWYKDSNHDVCFRDGNLDEGSKPESPHLLHFRNAPLKHVSIRAADSWDMIIQEKIRIPLNVVRLYNTNGQFTKLVELTRHIYLCKKE